MYSVRFPQCGDSDGIGIGGCTPGRICALVRLVICRVPRCVVGAGLRAGGIPHREPRGVKARARKMHRTKVLFPLLRRAYDNESPIRPHQRWR